MPLVLKIRGEKDGLSFSYSQIQTIRACVQLLFREKLRQDKSEHYVPSCIKRKIHPKNYATIDLEDAEYEGKEMKAISDLFSGDADFVPDYEMLRVDYSLETIYTFPAGLDESLVSVWRGFQAFVDHSDADGFHSVGDCIDICSMFDYISPLILKLNGDIRMDFSAIRALYDAATNPRIKREIFFC